MTARRARSLPTRALLLCAAVSGVTTSVPAAYLGMLTCAAVLRGGDRPGRNRVASDPTRFAVCVPAHNEEATIAETVRALASQEYPRQCFEIHVVADNCADATAEVAADVGARVHVRTAPDDPGKGPALNWLGDRLVAGDGVSPSDFDVLVVIDADTIAEPGFLAALHDSFAAGARVVQGYYGVAKPTASPTIALRYAALACRHDLRPRGRRTLGGSCGLFGNGMAFRRDVLVGRRWTGHLVEDAEMQMLLLVDGEIVEYVPAARVAAEMPESLDQATSQNERWELGRAQLVHRFARPLARSTLKGGALPRRVYADALADLLLPPTSVLAALDVGALAVTGLAASTTRTPASRAAVTAVGVAIAILVGHVLYGLRLVRAPAAVYRGLLAAPRAIVWKVALLARVVRRPGEVSWTRTRRNAEADGA